MSVEDRVDWMAWRIAVYKSPHLAFEKEWEYQKIKAWSPEGKSEDGEVHLAFWGPVYVLNFRHETGKTKTLVLSTPESRWEQDDSEVEGKCVENFSEDKLENDEF